MLALVLVSVAFAILLNRYSHLLARYRRIRQFYLAKRRADGEQRRQLEHDLELRRLELQLLRGSLRDAQNARLTLERRIDALRAELNEEIGLRHAAQQTDDNRSVWIARLQRELSEAQMQRREREQQARQDEAALRETIAAQAAELEKLKAAAQEPRPRRSRHARQETRLDQISMEEILKNQ